MPKRKKIDLGNLDNIEQEKSIKKTGEKVFKDNEQIEENDFPNEEVGDNDNPLLQQPIIKRDYSGGENFDIKGEVIDSVEEPDTKKPIVDFTKTSENNEEEDEEEDFDKDFDEEEEEDEEEDLDGGGEKRNYEENSEKMYDNFDDLSSETQKMLTGNFADTCVDGYKLLVDLIKNYSKKTIEGYQMKAIQGKFDMRVLDFRVDVGGGQYIRYGDFVNQYNEIVEQVMVVSPDTEKEARMLLKRIAKKHGLGLSDEWRLAMVLGTDAVTKVGVLISQNRMMKNVERYVTDMFRKNVIGVQQKQQTQSVQNSQKTTQQTTANETNPKEQVAQEQNTQQQSQESSAQSVPFVEIKEVGE